MAKSGRFQIKPFDTWTRTDGISTNPVLKVFANFFECLKIVEKSERLEELAKIGYVLKCEKKVNFLYKSLERLRIPLGLEAVYAGRRFQTSERPRSDFGSSPAGKTPMRLVERNSNTRKCLARDLVAKLKHPCWNRANRPDSDRSKNFRTIKQRGRLFLADR